MSERVEIDNVIQKSRFRMTFFMAVSGRLRAFGDVSKHSFLKVLFWPSGALRQGPQWVDSGHSGAIYFLSKSAIPVRSIVSVLDFREVGVVLLYLLCTAIRCGGGCTLVK